MAHGSYRVQDIGYSKSNRSELCSDYSTFFRKLELTLLAPGYNKCLVIAATDSSTLCALVRVYNYLGGTTLYELIQCAST
jgi:hypothetical protein